MGFNNITLYSGGSSKDVNSSQHSKKEEISSCRKDWNASKYLDQNRGQTGCGNDGDEPNEDNGNPKRAPDDKNVIEDEEDEEEETEDDSEPDDEDIEYNFLGNVIKIKLTAPNKIPEYPENLYHTKAEKPARSATGCFVEENIQDKFVWVETKQSEIAKKTKTNLCDDKLIGRRISKTLRCQDENCSGRKIIGFPTKKIAQNHIIYVRSIRWTQHSCNRGKCSHL